MRDIITKCNSYFVTKCERSLLQNASGFLLQNSTVLLQNATFITKRNNFITKCDSYYKMQGLLKIATVQSETFIAKLCRSCFSECFMTFLKTTALLRTFEILETMEEHTYTRTRVQVLMKE